MSPISCLLREIVRWNPEITFYGGLSPKTEEDAALSYKIKQWDNFRKFSVTHLFTKRFDFVHHASAGKINYFISRVCRQRGFGKTKHVFTANCQPYPTHPRLELLKKCVVSADEVVSVSEAVANDFRKLGLPISRIIPNGFDESFYKPVENRAEFRSTLGISEKYFLFSSTLTDRKKPEFLLDLAEKMTDVNFIMTGMNFKDSFSNKILERVSTLPNVVYLGAVSRAELRDLMLGAEALLHPSEYEGLPLTVVEAIGAGLPVVAQPRSSLPEIIEDSSCGFLLDINKIFDWEQKLREILSWSELVRNEFITGARTRAVKRFSWQRIGVQYGEFYHQSRRN